LSDIADNFITAQAPCFPAGKIGFYPSQIIIFIIYYITLPSKSAAISFFYENNNLQTLF